MPSNYLCNVKSKHFHLIEKTHDIYFKHVHDFTRNKYIIDSVQCPLIGAEDPVASEAGPAFSGVGEVPIRDLEVLQDAFQGVEVATRPEDRQDASPEEAASRIQAEEAFLLAGILFPAVLAACEVFPLVEEASEPSDEIPEALGAVEAWPLVGGQGEACSPRPPSCWEEEAQG